MSDGRTLDRRAWSFGLFAVCGVLWLVGTWGDLPVRRSVAWGIWIVAFVACPVAWVPLGLANGEGWVHAVVTSLVVPVLQEPSTMSTWETAFADVPASLIWLSAPVTGVVAGVQAARAGGCSGKVATAVSSVLLPRQSVHSSLQVR